MARRIVGAIIAGALFASTPAHALELPKLFGKHLVLDVTEVSIVSQRFDSREVNPITEGGAWGQWVNRINAKLDWNHFEVGVRLDSAVYWNTLGSKCTNSDGTPSIGTTVPSGAGNLPCDGPPLVNNVQRDNLTRYQNSIYPAKIWGSYKHNGLEVTVGDAYVQFARGLVLSMRKLDDLGIDNTVRGLKVSYARGPFAVTAIAGIANPSRVDEATGEALFGEKTVSQTNPAYKTRLAQPVFGADQIYGSEIQAGREKPVVLTTSTTASRGPLGFETVKLNRPRPAARGAGLCTRGSFERPVFSPKSASPVASSTRDGFAIPAIAVTANGPRAYDTLSPRTVLSMPRWRDLRMESTSPRAN